MKHAHIFGTTIATLQKAINILNDVEEGGRVVSLIEISNFADNHEAEFSMVTKISAKNEFFFSERGELKWPYLQNGSTDFAHFRT